jgi:hypothetical protein
MEIATCDGLRIPANVPTDLAVFVPFLWVQKALGGDKTTVGTEWREAWHRMRAERVGVIIHLPHRQRFEALVHTLCLAVHAPPPKCRDEWFALTSVAMEILGLVTQITHGDQAAKKVATWRDKWNGDNVFDIVELMGQVEALAPGSTGTTTATAATPTTGSTPDLRALTAQIQTLASQVAELKRTPFRRQ